MDTNSNQLYIVSSPTQACPRIADKFTYWASHFANVSHFPYTKTRREKQPASIRCANESFAVASSGYPIAWRDGKQLRRASIEDKAAYEQICERIRLLRAEANDLLREAWKRGDMVHKSDAANWKPEAITTPQP